MKNHFATLGLIVALASPVAAQSDTFTHGPVINGFGAVAKVDPDLALPANLDFKVVFDVKAGVPGEKNNNLDSVARFMNMLGASGVPASRIHPAVVFGALLLAIVWWCANRLTRDCTLIDDDADSSGYGLLEGMQNAECRMQNVELSIKTSSKFLALNLHSAFCILHSVRRSRRARVRSPRKH